MKGPGRPKIPAALRKTRQLWVGLTEHEYQTIRRAAQLAKRNMRDWARDVALQAAKQPAATAATA